MDDRVLTYLVKWVWQPAHKMWKANQECPDHDPRLEQALNLFTIRYIKDNALLEQVCDFAGYKLKILVGENLEDQSNKPLEEQIHKMEVLVLNMADESPWLFSRHVSIDDIKEDLKHKPILKMCEIRDARQRQGWYLCSF